MALESRNYTMFDNNEVSCWVVDKTSARFRIVLRNELQFPELDF